MGGPSAANLKRIWPVLPIGSIAGFLVVTGFGLAARNFSGSGLLIAEMVILFCLNCGMIMTARLPGLGFIPGMFFGFTSFSPPCSAALVRCPRILSAPSASLC